jgi:phospholipid-transporting ATPase
MKLSSASTVWYLIDPNATNAVGFGEVFGSFMSFFVLYSYTIPVSLFVIIEGVRIVQRQFMVWDVKMVGPEGQPMKVNNSNLNEDLGAVQYVFSDKTGTLTRNEMVLRSVSIGGRVLNVNVLPTLRADSEVQKLARCIVLCNSAIPVESNEVPLCT